MASTGEDYYKYVHLFHKYKNDFKDIKAIEREQSISDCCDEEEYFNLENFQNFKKPCKQIGEYFSELYEYKFNGDRDIRCKFINYLINSDNTYNKITDIKTPELMEAYEKLSKCKHMCYTDINSIEKGILQDLTELYNLYENYDNIKIVNNGRTQEVNCDKASNCVEYYNTHINKCRANRKREFCDELAIFQGKYNNLMQSISNCGHIQKYLEHNETNYISPIITTTVISLIVISFSFLLFKFTPLGSCIRNRGIKNQKTKDKIYRDTLEQSYNYDNVEIDSSKDKYNVQYNSL